MTAHFLCSRDLLGSLASVCASGALRYVAHHALSGFWNRQLLSRVERFTLRPIVDASCVKGSEFSRFRFRDSHKRFPRYN